MIPYGCIATGPQTGFIEVVKNARTIAEVKKWRGRERGGGEGERRGEEGGRREGERERGEGERDGSLRRGKEGEKLCVFKESGSEICGLLQVSGVNNQTKLLDWIKSHQKK